MPGKKETAKLVPPYIPWKTFVTLIDGLRQGIPSRVDRSVMRTFSGAAQSGLMVALRYLNLTDTDGVPTGTLTALVHSEGSDRERILTDILKSAYPFLFESSFNLESTTSAHFMEQFAKSGTTGDTTRKAATFFLSAAKEAKLPISSYVTPKHGPKPGARNGKAAKKSTVKKPPKAAEGHDEGHSESQSPRLSWARELIAKFPTFDPAWPDEVKAKWFDGFKQLMEMDDQAE
ncbi:MAG: hypothetical protein EPO22_11650 [Dehalococcoidia bacterium]|nr:MAG: hypothetical protein EPO22_11650 [Dehalococcoidia bacterium]